MEGSTDWKGSELQKVCDYLVSATRGKSGKLGKVVAETVYFAVVNVTLYFVNSKEWQLKTRCRTTHLRDGILQQSHRGVVAGHFSSGKLYRALHQYWW